MFPVVVTMIVILVVAALVAAYVAFPHRGEQLPAVPWLGEAMARAAEAAPVLEEDSDAEFRLHPHDDPAVRR